MMKSVNLLKKSYLMAVILSAVVFVFFWANSVILVDRLPYSQPYSHVTEDRLEETSQPYSHVTEDGLEETRSVETPNTTLKVKNKLCYVNFKDKRSHVNKTTDLKMIYFVTATYPRPEQVPELTRLAHTLMHVPRLHWIIADDYPGCTDIVYDILRRSGLPFTHISSPKSYAYKERGVPRGVSNRRASLTWLRENVHEGVLYFGDDDNTFDLQLFDEIRNTKKVSMFPVGLIGNYGVSTPIVKDGKVVAFFDSWLGSRTWPVDMAGFAVNIEYLKPSASMPYILGHAENGFLVSLGLKLDDIEPLADNCSKVLVWHTKTAKQNKPTLKINLEKFDNFPKYGNFVSLLKEISRLGMAYISSHDGMKTYVIRNRTKYETSGGLQ